VAHAGLLGNPAEEMTGSGGMSVERARSGGIAVWTTFRR
jgi:hypothetical protein